MNIHSDRFKGLDEDDLRVFRRLDNVLAQLQSKGINTLNHARAFLNVAMEPGQGPTHYGTKLGAIQPVVSRLLLELGIRARSGEKGLGLIDRDEAPDDLRGKRYHMTPEGRVFTKAIAGILEKA
ncbi:hypothetical protein SAMN05519103_01954 [Rhizobiales bacterium GAS113]|nr:hypothetical protein SAMN05519103_01954 [Rhizobiales bacterium GAS113]